MGPHDRQRRQFLASGLAIGAALAMPGAAEAADEPKTASAPGRGRLTFHGIDTHNGATIGTLRVDLSRFEGGQYVLIKTFETVKNGRSDGPLLQGDELKIGRYELLLHVEDYFTKVGTKLPTPNFLGKIPVRFNIHADNQAFHIPVLFSPWSYSYYRGS